MGTDRWYKQGEEPQTDWERFALVFVEKLCISSFAEAFGMLSPGFRSRYAVSQLHDDYLRIASDKSVPIGPPWVLSSIDSWPDKSSKDLGMAYVCIGGDHNEAITPRISLELGTIVVSEIEWGRP